MNIRGWTISLFQPTEDHHQEVVKHSRRKARANGLLIVHTDEGIDGIVSSDATRLAQLARSLSSATEHLVGQNPFDRGRIEKTLVARFNWTADLIGLLDYALWDIAGKALGQPIHQLIGGCRDKVLAYASTVHHSTDERFIETVLACKEMGFKAIKLHPYCVPDEDMRLCRKVREAVGDEMILMLDTLVYPGPYTRRDAHRMARLLDELDFYWFEDPLHRTDLEGLAELRRSCERVLIRAADKTRDIREYAAMIKLGCIDIVAGPSAFGITDLLKLAHFAEIHGMDLEPHDFNGGTASLHVLMSIMNGRFYEIAVPRGSFDVGMYPDVYLDPCWIDPDGFIAAPSKPGLGFGIDLKAAALVTEHTIRS